MKPINVCRPNVFFSKTLTKNSWLFCCFLIFIIYVFFFSYTFNTKVSLETYFKEYGTVVEVTVKGGETGANGGMKTNGGIKSSGGTKSKLVCRPMCCTVHVHISCVPQMDIHVHVVK